MRYGGGGGGSGGTYSSGSGIPSSRAGGFGPTSASGGFGASGSGFASGSGGGGLGGGGLLGGGSGGGEDDPFEATRRRIERLKADGSLGAADATGASPGVGSGGTIGGTIGGTLVDPPSSGVQQLCALARGAKRPLACGSWSCTSLRNAACARIPAERCMRAHPCGALHVRASLRNAACARIPAELHVRACSTGG
eukprot:366011-Chlamydomonas_euryale.AAC.6